MDTKILAFKEEFILTRIFKEKRYKRIKSNMLQKEHIYYNTLSKFERK